LKFFHPDGAPLARPLIPVYTATAYKKQPGTWQRKINYNLQVATAVSFSQHSQKFMGCQTLSINVSSNASLFFIYISITSMFPETEQHKRMPLVHSTGQSLALSQFTFTGLLYFKFINTWVPTQRASWSYWPFLQGWQPCLTEWQTDQDTQTMLQGV